MVVTGRHPEMGAEVAFRGNCCVLVASPLFAQTARGGCRCDYVTVGSRRMRQTDAVQTMKNCGRAFLRLCLASAGGTIYKGGGSRGAV